MSENFDQASALGWWCFAPIARAKRCRSCKNCRVYVTQWCVSEKARDYHHTGMFEFILPVIGDCHFWEPSRFDRLLQWLGARKP